MATTWWQPWKVFGTVPGGWSEWICPVGEPCADEAKVLSCVDKLEKDRHDADSQSKARSRECGYKDGGPVLSMHRFVARKIWPVSV